MYNNFIFFIFIYKNVIMQLYFIIFINNLNVYIYSCWQFAFTPIEYNLKKKKKLIIKSTLKE